MSWRVSTEGEGGDEGWEWGRDGITFKKSSLLEIIPPLIRMKKNKDLINEELSSSFLF